MYYYTILHVLNYAVAILMLCLRINRFQCLAKSNYYIWENVILSRVSRAASMINVIRGEIRI